MGGRGGRGTEGVIWRGGEEHGGGGAGGSSETERERAEKAATGDGRSELEGRVPSTAAGGTRPSAARPRRRRPEGARGAGGPWPIGTIPRGSACDTAVFRQAGDPAPPSSPPRPP